MPFDGSGTYNRSFPPGGWQGDAAAGIKIKADRHDQHDADIATALSNMICKDGQSAPSADINWNAKKIVNMAPGVGPTDAATVGQVNGVRTFPSAINITGSFPESVIKFSGSTGPWGDSYVTADMAAGVRGATWVWNDKADFSGTDVMVLSEAAHLALHNKTAAPYIYLALDAVPAADTAIGVVQFTAKNSSDAAQTYAQIYSTIQNGTAGAVDSSLIFTTAKDGAIGAPLILGPVYTTMNRPVNALSIGTVNNASAGSGIRLFKRTSGFSEPINFADGGGGNRAMIGADADNSIIFRCGDDVTTDFTFTPGGAFTAAHSITSGAVITSGGGFLANSGAFAAAAVLYLRPYNNPALQTFISASGSMDVHGDIYSGGDFYAGSGLFRTLGTGAVLATGSGSGTVYLRGSGGTGEQATYNYQGNLVIGNQGYKAVAGDWAAGSDARIKTVLGDYDVGLNAILGLQIRRFVFNGNDATKHIVNEVEEFTHPHARYAEEQIEVVGLIAQEAEVVMPDLVQQIEAYIDNQPVSDFRVLDTTNILYALVNAVKELAERLTALEGAPA